MQARGYSATPCHRLTVLSSPCRCNTALGRCLLANWRSKHGYRPAAVSHNSASPASLAHTFNICHHHHHHHHTTRTHTHIRRAWSVLPHEQLPPSAQAAVRAALLAVASLLHARSADAAEASASGSRSVSSRWLAQGSGAVAAPVEPSSYQDAAMRAAHTRALVRDAVLSSVAPRTLERRLRASQTKPGSLRTSRRTSDAASDGSSDSGTVVAHSTTAASHQPRRAEDLSSRTLTKELKELAEAAGLGAYATSTHVTGRRRAKRGRAAASASSSKSSRRHRNQLQITAPVSPLRPLHAPIEESGDADAHIEGQSAHSQADGGAALAVASSGTATTAAQLAQIGSPFLHNTARLDAASGKAAAAGGGTAATTGALAGAGSEVARGDPGASRPAKPRRGLFATARRLAKRVTQTFAPGNTFCSRQAAHTAQHTHRTALNHRSPWLL